jgi:hypothetical protein
MLYPLISGTKLWDKFITNTILKSQWSSSVGNQSAAWALETGFDTAQISYSVTRSGNNCDRLK